jgi:hypothetical protein
MLIQDVEQNRPGKRGSHKKATSAKKKARNDENGDSDMAEGTPTKAKAANGRGKKVRAEATGNDDGDDNVLLRSGDSAPKKRKRRAGSVADEDNELHDETAASEQTVRPPEQRKSGHLALMQAGKGDEDTLEEKPIKKSRSKKVKAEETQEGQTIEPKNNGLDGRPSRVTKNAKKMKADVLKSEDLDDLVEAKTSNSPEEGKKALRTERLDDTTDPKTKSGVQADPKTATKPTTRRGKARKVKVEDAEEEDAAAMAGAPTAPEPKEEPKSKGRKSKANKGTKAERAEEEADVETADASENVGPQTPPDPQETNPKVKAGRKKGLAKTIAKPKISESPFVPT